MKYQHQWEGRATPTHVNWRCSYCSEQTPLRLFPYPAPPSDGCSGPTWACAAQETGFTFATGPLFGDPPMCFKQAGHDGPHSWEQPIVEAPSSREDRAQRRRALRCSFCPPNKVENRKRRAKHGAKPRKRVRRGRR